MKFNFFNKQETRSAAAPLNESPAAGKDGLGLSYGMLIPSRNSMLLSAVYRCVSVISDSIAQLPIRIYLDNNSTLREFREHPVYELLYRFPNRNITRFVLIKNMVSDMLLHGNAYAWIERAPLTMKPIAIHYIPATYISIQYNYVNPITPEVQYIINGFRHNIMPEDMIHILNYNVDGVFGISTIQYAFLSIENSMSSELHANNFFRSGANLAGILNVESALTKEQRAAIENSWYRAFRRPDKDKGTGIAVLQGNMKYQPLTVNPVDAQLLETRKFNVTDIARFFGVSPTKLFDFTHSSYSTVEATQLSFLTDTITPVLQKFELEFERKLFMPYERPTIDVQFDTRPLVRLDVRAQSEYYRSLYNMGAITPNEIRREIMKSPVAGGDNVFVQGAMTTMDNVIKGVNYNGAPPGPDAKK